MLTFIALWLNCSYLKVSHLLIKSLNISKSITSRDDKNLDLYLKDIASLPMVDKEEEVLLFQKIGLWDKLALDKIIEANLRFVVSVAKQFQNQWLSLPDLINEWNIGLIQAAEKFDHTRWFKFISYAVWHKRLWSHFHKTII